MMVGIMVEEVISLPQFLKLRGHFQRRPRAFRLSQLIELVQVEAVLLLPIQNCIKVLTRMGYLEVWKGLENCVCPNMRVDVDICLADDIL